MTLSLDVFFQFISSRVEDLDLLLLRRAVSSLASDVLTTPRDVSRQLDDPRLQASLRNLAKRTVLLITQGGEN